MKYLVDPIIDPVRKAAMIEKQAADNAQKLLFAVVVIGSLITIPLVSLSYIADAMVN